MNFLMIGTVVKEQTNSVQKQLIKRMEIKAMVLAEDAQVKDDIEYVTVTCMETGSNPLLQMFDYGLRPDEKQHKGKLVGKNLVVQIKTIRAIFAGRPQMQGSLVSVENKPAK